MFETPCILFAGGKSSRMGEDKSLLPFAGYKTLTQYQYTRLSQIFSTVYISCKGSSKFDFEANFLEDLRKDVFAPTIGFVSAFEKLSCEKLFVVSVDTPFVGQNEIERLFRADSNLYDATIAQTQEGIQPLCGIYHASLQKNFKQMLEDENHKLGYLLKKVETNYLTFEEKEPFFNLNHPFEYKEAVAKIQSKDRRCFKK